MHVLSTSSNHGVWHSPWVSPVYFLAPCVPPMYCLASRVAPKIFLTPCVAPVHFIVLCVAPVYFLAPVCHPCAACFSCQTHVLSCSLCCTRVLSCSLCNTDVLPYPLCDEVCAACVDPCRCSWLSFTCDHLCLKLGEDLYEGLWDEVIERRRPEFDEACLKYADTGDEEDLQALHEHLQAGPWCSGQKRVLTQPAYGITGAME